MGKNEIIAGLAILMFSLSACSQKEDVVEVNGNTLIKEVNESIEIDGCNRECLVDIGEDYLSALVNHDPGSVPLSNGITFVENITAMKPGEGLWQSAIAKSTFNIFVPDELNQSVGYLGMMTYLAPPVAPSGTSPEERADFAANAEAIEQPVIVAMRLTIKEGEIVEAEHLLSGIREQFLGTLVTVRPGLLTEIPANQRISHEALIALGVSYYDALDDNDGTLMPFAEDCERHENGMVTAGGNAGRGPNGAGTAGIARDCAGQLSSKIMTYIDRIENRRVFAADPSTGLVMGLSHFRHPMDMGPYEVIKVDGTTEMKEMDFAAFDLPAAHIFKIGSDGMVHEIEAMGFTTTYNAPTGWE